MLKTQIIRLLSAAAVLPVLLIDCSTSVSGVETGNPKISTLARIAIDLFNDKSAWQPSSYLINGEAQLNTSVIDFKPVSAEALPKRSAGVSDSVMADSGKYIIVERNDTIVYRSNVAVTDTLINKTVKNDTLIDSQWIENNLDSVIIISKRLYTDSIFVVDTVEILDTIVVHRYDTLYWDKSTSAFTENRPGVIVTRPVSAPVKFTTVNGTFGPVIKVYGNDISFEKQAHYNSNSYNSLMSISRKSNIAGVNAFEEYIDADGDGFLIEPNGSGTNKLTLNAKYSADLYDLHLNVLFDAGSDASFISTNDNRIYSLTRSRKVNGKVNESIIYGAGQLPSITDTVALTINKNFETDSISSVYTKYNCLPGIDKFDHNQNRLSSLTQVIKFRNCSIKSILITLSLDTLLDVSQIPSTAKMEACIDYGKGNSGFLNGIVDYKNKRVYGTYAENGTEYNYEYKYENDSFTCNPKNE